MSNILLIEDSPEVGRLVQGLLAPSKTTLAITLADAKAAIEKKGFDLIILDLSLPDGDGLKFYATLKLDPRVAHLPVIFLTSCTETWDKVTAFTLGAQDYITKPFDSLELRARVQARLDAVQENETVFLREDLRFDLPAQRVSLMRDNESEALDLTPLEFKILVHFARNENHVLSRNQIIDSIWGTGVYVLDRTVDSHISSLRSKIKSSKQIIDSVYGEGYVFGRRTSGRKKSSSAS